MASTFNNSLIKGISSPYAPTAALEFIPCTAVLISSTLNSASSLAMLDASNLTKSYKKSKSIGVGLHGLLKKALKCAVIAWGGASTTLFDRPVEIMLMKAESLNDEAIKL